MTDPAPAQKIRNLCDQISDLIEAIDPAAPIASYGASEGGGDGQIKYPMTDAMLDARSHLKGILVSWALMVAEEKRDTIDCEDEPSSIAAWLYQRADWIAAHPAFADFIMELEEAIAGLEDVTNRGVSTRKFCGWDNGRPVFAKDSELLSADATGQTLRNGRAALAITVLDVDLPAKDCAEALKLHGHAITAKQILKLHEVDERRRVGGKIGPYEGLSPVRREGPRNTPIFRVSEVLARLTRQQAS